MNKMIATKMSNLTIRIDENLKNDFIAAAKENDIDASKLVRQFIKKYVRTNAIEKQKRKSNEN